MSWTPLSRHQALVGGCPKIGLPSHAVRVMSASILAAAVVLVFGCGGDDDASSPDAADTEPSSDAVAGQTLAVVLPGDGRTLSIEVPDGWAYGLCTDPGVASGLVACTESTIAAAGRSDGPDCENGLYVRTDTEPPEYDEIPPKEYFGDESRGWLIADLRNDGECDEAEVQVPTSAGRLDITLVVESGLFAPGDWRSLAETISVK